MRNEDEAGKRKEEAVYSDKALQMVGSLLPQQSHCRFER